MIGAEGGKRWEFFGVSNISGHPWCQANMHILEAKEVADACRKLSSAYNICVMIKPGLWAERRSRTAGWRMAMQTGG